MTCISCEERRKLLLEAMQATKAGNVAEAAAIMAAFFALPRKPKPKT